MHSSEFKRAITLKGSNANDHLKHHYFCGDKVKSTVCQRQDEGNVRLRLNWIYYASHAGFALGKDKNFYKDAGININIHSGNGSGSAHRLVANRYSDFSYGSRGSMINLVAKGVKLVSVAVIDAMGADAVLIRPDAGITKIAAHERKTLLTTSNTGVKRSWCVSAPRRALVDGVPTLRSGFQPLCPNALSASNMRQSTRRSERQSENSSVRTRALVFRSRLSPVTCAPTLPWPAFFPDASRTGIVWHRHPCRTFARSLAHIGSPQCAIMPHIP